MNATAISAVVARRPAIVAGWVTGVAAHLRPWARLDIEFRDETGAITLGFLGRTQIPGIVTGCRMTVEGTPWMEEGTLVIVNPFYKNDDQSACKLPHGVPDEFQS